MRKIWLYIGGGVLLAALAVAAVFVFRPASDMSTPVDQAAAGGPGTEITVDDQVLGDPDAPVTIIEYASLTCPHCANFHNNILPALESEYIQTGKAKLVFRDFPLDGVALRAAALARCAGPERYHGFIKVLFRSQMEWAGSQDPLAALARLAKLGGIDDTQFAACIGDEERLDAIVESRAAAERNFQVNSTPTFIIQGRKYTGGLTLEGLRQILDPLVEGS